MRRASAALGLCVAACSGVGSAKGAGPVDAGVADGYGPVDAGPDGGAVSPPDGGLLFVVHYPVPAGHLLTLRGSVAPLSWTQGLPLSPGPNATWTLCVHLPPGTPSVDVKPLYDDATWALGPNWTVAEGSASDAGAVDLWPHFFVQTGTLVQLDNWASSVLGDSRTVWVYTPPSFAENPSEHFPVAYFQDGQNLFYDSLSFSGTAWDLQGAMDQGAQDGTIHEAFLVGIANDANRLWEYTPTNGGLDGGGAGLYLAFVAQELKPAIDAQYPTLTDAAHTAFVGSSLGGLLAAYAGLTKPTTFGLIGALSPSTWWDNQWIIGAVMNGVGGLQPLRVYLDSGNAGTDNDDVALTFALSQAYQDAGVDLDYLVQDGGQHGEVWWRERAPGALQFLLGPR